MTKIDKIPNELPSDQANPAKQFAADPSFGGFGVLDFSDLRFFSEFVSVRGAAFDIRISDLFRWLIGEINLGEAVPSIT